MLHNVMNYRIIYPLVYRFANLDFHWLPSLFHEASKLNRLTEDRIMGNLSSNNARHYHPRVDPHPESDPVAWLMDHFKRDNLKASQSEQVAHGLLK